MVGCNLVTKGDVTAIHARCIKEEEDGRMGVVVHGMDLTGVDLTGVDLTGVDLTGVDLTGSFDRATAACSTAAS